MRSTSASWTAEQLRNLRRDPRLSVVVASPGHHVVRRVARTRRRSRTGPRLALERKIALKYTGSHVDVEPSGTARYAATVIVEKITHQLGH